jgi:nitroreductase
MELVKAIRERRSIRKFKAIDVPPGLIAEILDTARFAPSWGNTQPWEFYVLTGQALSKVKEMNMKNPADGVPPSPDVPMPGNWPPVLKARYSELGEVVLTTMGINREDKAARDKYYQGMGSLFDAPCVILACTPRYNVIEYPMLDIGLVTQTICLLAHDKGLGTCIMAMAVLYAADIRKIAAIPDDKRIIIGIALGYPDLTFPLNSFDRKRAEITELVHWVV